jgi:hypothetical protein
LAKQTDIFDPTKGPLRGLSLFREALMAKKTGKPLAAESGPMFAVGLDEKGKPRGARFADYTDKLVSAVLDMGLSFVIAPSPAFAEAAKKLPEGRHYASGKAFVPNIRQALLDELVAIVRQPGDTSQAYRLEEKPGTGAGDSTSEQAVRCVSPITSGLPRNWDEIGVGHLVLAHESYEDGWWEAICVKRELDILTLRYRDAPKLPIFIRHVTTVALVNPGPLPETP